MPISSEHCDWTAEQRLNRPVRRHFERGVLFPSPSVLSSPSLPFPSSPLEVGPLNPARRSGGALWAPPAGSGAEPHPKSNLVHFSHKIWPLVATFSMIFFRINWPIFFAYADSVDLFGTFLAMGGLRTPQTPPLAYGPALKFHAQTSLPDALAGGRVRCPIPKNPAPAVRFQPRFSALWASGTHVSESASVASRWNFAPSK